jgi:hypothetical protein
MRDDLESRLEDLGRVLGTDASMVPRVMDRIEQAPGDQPAETRTMKYESSIRRLVMNRISKFAAAAVIVIGVIVGYGTLKGTGGVSWAQVRQQVAASGTVTYTVRKTGVEQAQDLRVEVIQSSDYGTRMDTYLKGDLVGQAFTLMDEGVYVTLMPWNKQYTAVKLTDPLREEIRLSSADPTRMVDDFLQSEYTELGRREIDGIVVEGLESRELMLAPALFTGTIASLSSTSGHPGAVTAQLWVEVATGWPVELTLDITTEGQEQVQIVLSDFQWDVELAPEALVREIPADYKALATVDVGGLESGEEIVEALAYFAEISGGTYPTNLTVRDVVGELGAIYQTLDAQGAAPEMDDNLMIKLKFAAAYVGELDGEGKEPVYYGDTVTAADADKVLLRWKLSDTQYRVIFGDLRIEDVSPERLAELEAQ